MALIVDIKKLVEHFHQGAESYASSEEICCADVFVICANALQKALDDNNDHFKKVQ